MSAAARVLRGLLLPLELRRAVLRDDAASRLYRRVAYVQAAITLLVGALLGVAVFALVLRLAESHAANVFWSPRGLQIRSTHDPAVPSDGWALDSPTLMVPAFAYVLFGTLALVEGIVIALSREYHDQIGRRAALLSDLPPEDPESTPRVRLNLRWVWTRLKRKLRGLKAFVAGLPVFGLVALVPRAGPYLYAGISFVWSSYWLAVFAGAKSARAWHDESTASDPYFLRAAGRVPILRWYVRPWRALTRALFAPCRRVEEAPLELAGLAAARLFGTIPVLYLFLRPFLPVAAAAIIVDSARSRGRGEDPSLAPTEA
jgi:hypothetical protein